MPRPRRAGRTATADLPSEELGLVFGWLRRCTGDDALAEQLTVEVFRRRAEPGPAWLDRAPAEVRLRHLVVLSVLRARGAL